MYGYAGMGMVCMVWYGYGYVYGLYSVYGSQGCIQWLRVGYDRLMHCGKGCRVQLVTVFWVLLLC